MVDVVPIDFNAAEARALERTLYTTVGDIKVAMNLALNVVLWSHF